VCGEGGAVAGWGGQDSRDGDVVGEGGEVEDCQGVEERVGFSVCLAAGEADGMRRGGGRGRGDVAAVGVWGAKAGFGRAVGGCGVEKEEVVYGVSDFAGGEEEGACGCGCGIGRWGGEGSLSTGGFAGAPEGEGEFAAGGFHCGALHIACRCIMVYAQGCEEKR